MLVTDAHTCKGGGAAPDSRRFGSMPATVGPCRSKPRQKTDSVDTLLPHCIRMTQTPIASPRGVAAPPFRESLASVDSVDHWDLVELVAEGSLTRLHRARARRTGPDRPAAYALKLLRREMQEKPWTVELMRREALVGRQVAHPHLVSILAGNVRRAPYYVVMPWLEGATLKSQLDQGMVFDVPEVLWIARQIAEALQALDAAGWMHADIKPSNVHRSPEGHVTLLDLGFARRVSETGSAIDRAVLGTFEYMAPETISSSLRTDIRSDFYSLGVMLFELLTGRPPFPAGTLAELATAHREGSLPDLTRLAPHLSDEVASLLRQLLAKQPMRRPQTPAELIDRLVALEIATFSQRALV